MIESKYLYNILEKMSCPEIFNNEICSICLELIMNPPLTTCGHLFCYECLRSCLQNKQMSYM